MSSSNCCFLTCKQISQQAGEVVWYSSLLKNFPQFAVIHTVKGFGIVNKVDACLERCCFFYNLTDIGNLISGSSTFSKSSLNIWKFMVHILLKPSLENFEHYFASYQRGLIIAAQRLCENFMYWETLSYLQLIFVEYLWNARHLSKYLKYIISVNCFNQGVSRSHSYSALRRKVEEREPKYGYLGARAVWDSLLQFPELWFVTSSLLAASPITFSLIFLSVLHLA